MKAQRRDRVRLWRDTSLPGGLELLRASCFDHSYPAHFHDEFVIAAFADGAQRHRIARHDGIATAGTVMIIAPGEVHTGAAVERDRGWDYCAFYPSAAFLNTIADDVLGGRGHLDFGRNALRHDTAVTNLLLRANVIVASTPDVLERQCAAYDAFAAVIVRYGERIHPGPEPKPQRANIRQSVDYLQAYLAEPIAIKEVAAIAGLSEYHFMRTFREATGLSVHRYLTQLRLHRAKALLAQGFSAAETAVSVGLFDQSHLIRLFRSHFGITPREFAAACR